MTHRILLAVLLEVLLMIRKEVVLKTASFLFGWDKNKYRKSSNTFQKF